MIAILTNSFMPCNGRFPTLIALISMFFVSSVGGIFGGIWSAVLLLVLISGGVFLTFFVSKLLSVTILRGMPSAFTLELPPYRRPQIGKVVVRSVFDRTLFVLGRAVSVAVPAGVILWMLANISWSGQTLLIHSADFLDPFARKLGLDGVILLAFLLGFPANEIVIPIMLMVYMTTGQLTEMPDYGALKNLLADHGWTWKTAVSTMMFCMIHWPCSTTCLTIKKETGSIKWTVAAILIPGILGMGICFLFNLLTSI